VTTGLSAAVHLERYSQTLDFRDSVPVFRLDRQLQRSEATMRKIAFLMIAAAALALSLPTSASAAETKGKGFLSGVVYVVTTPVRVVTKPFRPAPAKKDMKK
jgi:hypothetical protein